MLWIIYILEGECKNERSPWACPHSGTLLSVTCPGPPARVGRTHTEGAWKIEHDVEGLCTRTSFLHGWEGCYFSRELLFLYLSTGSFVTQGSFERGDLGQGDCGPLKGKAESTQISGDLSHFCSSRWGPSWCDAPWTLVSFWVADLLLGSPLQPSCRQPRILDEAKPWELNLELGTQALYQRASRKKQDVPNARSHLACPLTGL